MNNGIEMLNDTLSIFEKGYYYIENKKVKIKLTRDEQKNVKVFLPNEINELENYRFDKKFFSADKCVYGCENADSFSAAREMIKKYPNSFSGDRKVLVLNFANPIRPGGGVRYGALAQEEDLCRKSSLLISLESRESEKYYEYNKNLCSNMGSDAIIVTPKVEIIKDEKGNLLDESVIVSVITCAAPIIRYDCDGIDEEEYKSIFYNRIMGILRCAAVMGYENLVLGAFGCGAFGNDARVVSDLFYKALKNFEIDGMKDKDCFNEIRFAVLDYSAEKYNFNEFYRNFNNQNFYRDEIKAETPLINAKRREREKYLNKIKGSMFGGAIGDALGYTVEFMSDWKITERFGKDGITEYVPINGIAQISDDTQMSLFTANGILFGETMRAIKGISGEPHVFVPKAYQDWLITQENYFDADNPPERLEKEYGISWLLDVPELFNRRAPGGTCLNALEMRRSYYYDNDCCDEGLCAGEYTKYPINDSKGCGGIMRTAPLGLYYKTESKEELKDLDKIGAELSAVTHGHSLGYMPSAVLTHILNRIVCSTETGMTLEDIVVDARDTIAEMYSEDEHIDELVNIINNAIELSKNEYEDSRNIQMLGEGWVAEETLAIAIYCSLRHSDDFSKGIIAAVNHSGDSDSTGAVTGNILGALLGFDNIEQKWLDNLELYDVIDEISTDLCYGCVLNKSGNYNDPEWVRKYVDCRRICR